MASLFNLGLLTAAGVAFAGISTGVLDNMKLDYVASTNANITYPPDLGPYYISFKFNQYVRPDITNPPILQFAGGIKLPIPGQLINAFHVAYDAEAVGSSIAATAATAGGIMGQVDQVKSLGTAASYIAGVTTNPYLAYLFKSPSFKKHTFQWRLAPNTPRDSLLINQIIALFEKNMLPTLVANTAGLLFQFPSVVSVFLYANDPNASYLYKFKHCVIEDFDVNYAPSGSPSFFNKSSAPPVIDIKVSLAEIELWTSQDVS